MEGGTGNVGVDGKKALTRPGIGVDITSVARLQALAQRRPEVLSRLFTPGELADAGTTRQQWPRLASRFAAKEALIKAAEGLHGSRYIDIEIRRRSGDAPMMTVQGPISVWLAERGLTMQLSLSHENLFAIAFVVLHREGIYHA